MNAPMNLKNIQCPPCSHCGQATRIYGIEPHAGTSRTEILTYVCDGCEVTEVRIAPAVMPAIQ